MWYIDYDVDYDHYADYDDGDGNRTIMVADGDGDNDGQKRFMCHSIGIAHAILLFFRSVMFGRR